MSSSLQNADVGLNLKLSYIDEVLDTRPDIGFFEVIAENLLDSPHILEKIKTIGEHYPIHLHCVGMNIGGNDPLDFDYLQQLKKLIAELSPRVVSDHLCFQRHNHISHFDLLPFALNDESLAKCQQRLLNIQSFLEHKVMVENLTNYVEFKSSSMSEAVFLVSLCEEANTKILLDLNNIALNELNLGVGMQAYLDTIPVALIGQIHLAGGKLIDGIWVDTHGCRPSEQQIELISQRNLTHIPICYERDTNVPELKSSHQVVEAIKASLSQ